MGIERRPLSVKLSDEERAKLLEIHDALVPMHESLSQTFRWTLRTMHTLIFTEKMLARLVGLLQGVPRQESVVACPTHTAPERRARRERPVASGVRGPLRFLATTTKQAGMWARVQACRTSYADFRPVLAGAQEL